MHHLDVNGLRVLLVRSAKVREEWGGVSEHDEEGKKGEVSVLMQ